MPDLPKHLLTQRDHLIAEIHVAFKNAKRGRGTSWAEADVIDEYGTEKERRAARAKDVEQHWPTLINHSMWKPWNVEWSYLDAEGFRFYLAPGMIREALDAERESTSNFAYVLTGQGSGSETKSEGQWSLLDDRQRRCVKLFLEFMIECDRIRHAEWISSTGRENEPFRSEWLVTLNSYWASIPDA